MEFIFSLCLLGMTLYKVDFSTFSTYYKILLDVFISREPTENITMLVKAKLLNLVR